MYRISEVSKLVGLPIPTIRYYEKLGLIETPTKDARGYKVYNDKIVQYLEFIVNLKDTDMSLEQIKDYVDSYNKKNISRCYIILQEHAKKIQFELAKRQQILEKVQYKISHYSSLTVGGKCNF